MKVSLLNRKLYIVSGDMRLLQNYWNKNNSYLLDSPENNGPEEGNNGEIQHTSDGEDQNNSSEKANGSDSQPTRGSLLADANKGGQQHL